MKIGILTFHFADNYGAVLQAYALKEYMAAFDNCNVKIIDYVNSNLEKAYSINPLNKKSVLNKIRAVVKLPFRVSQRKKFINFRKQYLQVHYGDRKNIMYKQYDRLVVGSDQVWNMDITFNDLKYFFSDVNTGVKLYSYAASSKDEFVPEEYRSIVSELLSRFTKVSVREAQLKNLLKEKYGISSKLVVDPVYLQSKEFWENKAKQIKGIPNNYVLLYALKENKRLEAVAKELERKTGYKLLIVHPTAQRVVKEGKQLYNIGPLEFLYILKNASIIVSNSFHAFSFGCIFSKEIYFDFLSETSNRIENLIDLFGLKVENKDNAIYYVRPEVYGTEDYNSVIEESKEYIREIIE